MEQRGKTRVAVIFGGRSSEHAISCISAGSVLSAIDRTKFEVIPVGITTAGRWVVEADEPERLRIIEGRLPEVDPAGAPVYVPVDPDRLPPFPAATAAALIDSQETAQGLAALRDVDVVFPVLHGPWGEDGTIQGLLELAGIPYVGSGVFASAAAMDKAHMKALLRAAGLRVGPYEVVTDRQWLTDRADCLARVASLGGSVFVKPARAGSSVGISKVAAADQDGLVAAIEAAREHDRKLVVEAGFADVREVECGVLDGPQGPTASVCAEIVVHPDHDFYDYAAKYLEDAVDLVVPAELPPAVADSVREQAIAAFQALDCEGLSRVDFFVTPQGEAIVNEVNTMPGFTSISMFPRMWQETGVSYPALIDHLISDAIRRGVGLR